jgi:hypothetical protein
MYILIGTVFGLIIFLFGSTIVKLFILYAPNDYQKGNIWFMSLLIINIIVIVFIYIYNYYISNKIGLKGNDGPSGNIGSSGEGCCITDPKQTYYKQYTILPVPT